MHESPRQNLRRANQRQVRCWSLWRGRRPRFLVILSTEGEQKSAVLGLPRRTSQINLFARLPHPCGDNTTRHQKKSRCLFFLDTVVIVEANTITRSRDIAAEAYQDAVRYLETEFKGDDQTTVWLQKAKCTSLVELQDATHNVEIQYRQASQSRHSRMQWLKDLSSGVMHYGKVLDTLAQHHPEYVGLVWGIIKFVLMVR